MVKTTRPEGILISDHLSTSHILGFLASLKELPDLWLIPILIVHDPPPLTSTTTAAAAGTAAGGGEGGGEEEVDNSSSSGKPGRHRVRKKKALQEEDATDSAGDTSPSLPSSSTLLQQQQQQQQYHLEMLRLGVRSIITPSSPSFPELQALLDGAKLTRGQVETLVSSLQGAVLHLSQHRKRLLPSTITIEGPPPLLTGTEQEVLNLLSRGMTDQQIAYSLGCTSATVGNAVRGLLEKLGVDLRGELIRVALDNDLLTD
jgi:DNA-binding NarL/FixJ family response regulator